jgi:aminoglycoside phosphotransferase (APT) family kinase protein
VNLDAAGTRARVERMLANLAHAERVEIAAWNRLSGGAIQQNLAIDVNVSGGPHAGRQRWVLRTDAPSAVAASRGRTDEFALLQAAHAAGVHTAEPLFVHAGDEDTRAFFVMRRVDGIAAGHRLTRDGAVPDASSLLREIGANLARIHGIDRGDPRLAVLGPVPQAPTRALLAEARAYLDHWRAVFDQAWPALEWGIHWWSRRAPDSEPVAFVHRDYRIGNLMVEDGRLVATLDWEFAGWGNPLEDLGWFTAPCWRFAGRRREAGGIGDTEDLLAGYNAVRGSAIRPEMLPPWQALAQIRWSVIALQQTERFMRHGERSLELALTGRLVPELELDLLRLLRDSDAPALEGT